MLLSDFWKKKMFTYKRTLSASVCSMLLAACASHNDVPNQQEVQKQYSLHPAQLVVLSENKTDDYAEYAESEGSYLWLPQETSPFGIVFDMTFEQNTVTFVSSSARFTVHFATDSAVLTAKAKATLKKAANEYRGQKVAIRGYADPRYTASYNKALSVRRADAVAKYLKQQGVKIGYLHGFGEQHPLETNAKSRRVTVEGADE